MNFDMVGKKYGRLLVLDQYYKFRKNKDKRDFCLCQCDCGSIPKEIAGKNIRMGVTISCGCFLLEIRGKALKKYNRYDLSGEYGICYFFSSDKSFFIFDKEDYEKIKNFCWHNSHGYAESRFPYPLNKRRIRLHNLVMNNSGLEKRIDHINRNSLDNRKVNLRFATHQQNDINKGIQSNNTSGIRGVCPTDDGYWETSLVVNQVRVFRKVYKNFKDAVIARLEGEKHYFGEFAPQRHLFEKYEIS